ncbi:MAG: replication endonuclease [Bacilli bacterium]
MLKATKRLQNTDRYKEFITLRDDYYHTSLKKEHNQQSYLKNMTLKNNATGELLQIHHSFEKYYKNYTKSIEQKVYAVEKIARDRDLVPVFITLTLPSRFHPFQSIKHNGNRNYVALNENFEFKSIEEAISTGYQYLNHIYRTFYKRVKLEVKELLYIKVVEQHKTLIPHFHILFYVKKEKNKIIQKIFDNIINEFELIQTDLEFIGEELQEVDANNVKTGINRVSKYITKYIVKNLNDNAEFFNARVLDGWKRHHKIRIITMSNLPLSLAEYRAIYHNLDAEIKEELLNEAKKQDMSLFSYILENMFKFRKLHKERAKTIKKYGNIDKAKIHFFANVTRYKRLKGYLYTLDSFTLFINHKLIYEKQHYTQIMEIYNHEHKTNYDW